MAASFWWGACCRGRRGLLPGPRAGTWPSVPSRQACSYSPGGRPPGAAHDPRGVVPAGPFAGGRLDLGGGFPWPQVAGDLGLIQPDDALGQRVVIGIPDGPDRRRDARSCQLGAVADGQVLAAGVGVVDQPGHLDALAGAVGDRHHQRVQHQVRAVAGGGAPPGDQPGERVDDERGIGGARPGGYEGEVDHPQPVRGVRREAAVHQVRRPVLRRVRDRRPRLLPPAAAHPRAAPACASAAPRCTGPPRCPRGSAGPRPSTRRTALRCPYRPAGSVSPARHHGPPWPAAAAPGPRSIPTARCAPRPGAAPGRPARPRTGPGRPR